MTDTWRVCARVPAGFDCWGDQRPCFTGSLDGLPAHLRFKSDVIQLARATDACASCVLLRSAHVKCTFMDSAGRTQPEREVLPNAAALAAGGGHFCALLASGKVACWGANDSGQIGQPPSTSEITEPQLLVLE